MAYDRSKGKLHEKDHSHKHEKDFRVAARRNKLLGLWAAELMNIRGADAESYAKQVVSADLDEPGDEDVLRKVLGDFQRRGVLDDPRDRSQEDGRAARGSSAPAGSALTIISPEAACRRTAISRSQLP